MVDDPSYTPVKVRRIGLDIAHMHQITNLFERREKGRDIECAVSDDLSSAFIRLLSRRCELTLYGRRTRMKSIPSKYFELADPITGGDQRGNSCEEKEVRGQAHHEVPLTY